MISLRSFCRLAELVKWQRLAIWFAFARGVRAILQKPTGGLFVFKKERFDANYLKGLRETTQNFGRTVEQINCKHLQRLMYYQTGTCLCGSAVVRDSQQTISDLLPEPHGCFGTGWVEFLLVATHQHLTNRCFGCEDWYSRGLVGSWKHFCCWQRLWSKPPHGSKEGSLEHLMVDLNGKPRWKRLWKFIKAWLQLEVLNHQMSNATFERSLWMTYFKPLWFGTKTSGLATNKNRTLLGAVSWEELP